MAIELKPKGKAENIVNGPSEDGCVARATRHDRSSGEQTRMGAFISRA
jgi:hypothetical protein